MISVRSYPTLENKTLRHSAIKMQNQRSSSVSAIFHPNILISLKSKGNSALRQAKVQLCSTHTGIQPISITFFGSTTPSTHSSQTFTTEDCMKNKESTRTLLLLHIQKKI